MRGTTLFGALLVVAAVGAAVYVLGRDTACAGWETDQVKRIVLQELRDQAPLDPEIPDAYDATIDEADISFRQNTWLVPIAIADRLGNSARYVSTISCSGGGMIAIARLKS